MKLSFWFVLFCSFVTGSSASEVGVVLLQDQIKKLAASQEANGAFYPVNCLNKKMTKKCKGDRSLFFTGLIAESLRTVPEGKEIHGKALQYLIQQYDQQKGQLHYYENDFPLFKIVKPDMDDNAMVYALLLGEDHVDQKELKKNYQSLYELGFIKAKLKQFKTERPYFATWLPPKSPFFDDIDLVVNANALFSFGAFNKKTDTPVNLAPVCDTVNDLIKQSAEKDFEDLQSIRHWTWRRPKNHSQWYPSKYAVMYSLVRAHLTQGESSCLKPSYQLIRKHLISHQTYGENIYDKALASAALSRIAFHEGIAFYQLESHLKDIAKGLEEKKFGKHPFYFYGAIGYTGCLDLVRAMLIEGISYHLKNSGRLPASPLLAEKDFLEDILDEQMDDGSFTALIIPSSPLYNIFVIMMYEYLGVSEGKKDIIKGLTDHIFSQQKESGALAGYPTGPDHPGISTAGYVAARIAGIDENDPRMKKLEASIHRMGGPLKSDMLTMPFLMMFSLYPIHSTHNVGLDALLLKFNDAIPWVKVLINPVLYLLDNGHNKILSEAKYPKRIFKQSYEKYAKRKKKVHAPKNDKFSHWAMENINPDGTFFDYTPTTVPMLMALSTIPGQEELVTKGVRTIESFQTKSDGGLLQTPGEASIGETFYMANVLLDVGLEHDHPAVKAAEKYLLEHQLNSGGWGFSKNSIHFADSDDTSNAMYFLMRLDEARKKEPRAEVIKALKWMLTLQNRDGGFGTWERTRGRIFGPLLNRVANRKGLVMSESVLEHTARILVSLSRLRHLPEADAAYKKAYQWLLKRQKKDGSFAGTWFINYIFSTSMSMTALGTDPHSKAGQKAIRKGIAYLKEVQSMDGGYGESPDSFLQKKAIPLPESSTAQTGLIASQLHTLNQFTSCMYHQEITDLLDTTFLYLKDQRGAWTQIMDPTWTAVTFPKVEYLIYPYIQRIAPWQAYNMQLTSKCR